MILAAILACWFLLQPLAAAPAAAAQRTSGPAPASEHDRYIELYKRKIHDEKLAGLLKAEADLSAKKKAYLVLDLPSRKLLFKIRGRSFKAIPLTGIDFLFHDRAAGIEDLAGRAYTLELKEGKGVETESINMKSLTPDEAAAAGAVEGDAAAAPAEQGEITSGPPRPKKTAGTGAPPVTQKMAGVAGGAIPPDPPPRYHLGFDNGLSIWVVADDPSVKRDPYYETILDWAKGIGHWFKPAPPDEGAARLVMHTTLDHGRQLFRQLICGQQLLIAP